MEGERAPLGVGILLGAVAGCLALRLPFITWNAAEYTDGILMIARDQFGATYWPPLYSWATWMIAAIPGLSDREIAGRVVSIFASSLAVIPLMMLAADSRLGGPRDGNDARRHAMYAALLFAVSPEIWRWSIRVMAEGLFLPLWLGSLAAYARDYADARDGKPPGKAFAWGNILGAAAALTRHQGIFLLPIGGLLLMSRWGAVRRGQLSFAAVGIGALSVLCWLAWPLTQATQALGHAGQVSFRAAMVAGLSPDASQAAAESISLADRFRGAMFAGWIMVESFLYLIPYLMTPIVFLLALFGLSRPRDRSAWAALAAMAWLTIAILGLQGVFQSFLGRYLVPLLPLYLIYAARGLAHMEDSAPRGVHRSVLILALSWSALLGLGSLVLQREAFGDLRAAANLARVANEGKSPHQRSAIYSNEVYKPEAGLGAIKLTYWIGEEVHPLGQLPAEPAPGTLVIVSSAYGGPAAYTALVQQLQSRGAKLVRETDATLTPLLTDIMQQAEGGHQSPVAWPFRYQPQRFRSALLRF